jgi:hypothetical protein
VASGLGSAVSGVSIRHRREDDPRRQQFCRAAPVRIHFRELSDVAKAEYRRPFLKREDRWPTLSWPRQLPIAGEPPHIVELVQTYGKWMSESDIPKLFIMQTRAR